MPPIDANHIGFVLILMAGGFLQAITGFGFALVVVPPSIVLVDRLTVVTAVNLLSPVLNLLLLRQIEAKVEWQVPRWVLPAAVVGMPLGLIVLFELPNGPFRILAGSLSILFASLLQAKRFSLPQTRPVYAATGFVSGTLQTSTTLSGPPIVMLLLSGDRTAAAVRRTLATIFLGMTVPTLILLTATQSFTREGLTTFVVATPLVLLAGYAGDRVSRRLPSARFRLLSLATIYATGIFGVVSGILG